MAHAKMKHLGPVVSLTFMATGALAQEMTFGYVPGSMIYPYNVATADGFEAEASAAGIKTVVLDPQGEVEGQGNAIDDLIAQQVDGIAAPRLGRGGILCRSHQRKRHPGRRRRRPGDPHSRELTDVYPGLNALVMPDDVLAGEQAGELALTLLPTDRAVKIAIVEGAPGYSAVTDRTEGFRKALDEAGLQYEIVGSPPTDWTPEVGESVCQNFLTANPDLDLIFSHADDMAISCARALDATGSEAKRHEVNQRFRADAHRRLMHQRLM